jgi:ABC-type polar amino acid transport system ATPase subunit
VLEVSGLRKSFGRNEVLKGLDVAVRPGELTVVLGAKAAASRRSCAARSAWSSRTTAR